MKKEHFIYCMDCNILIDSKQQSGTIIKKICSIKDNISKVVNAITGTPETIDMTGTWTYSGSAVEFESDNLLMKAGGAAAATMAENKLNEQLTKVGIKEGQMSFTFNADSTFTSTVGKKRN